MEQGTPLRTPYAVRRGQTWFVRLRIPADLAPILGQHHTRTLQTTDFREAKSRAAAIVGAAGAWWPVLRNEAMALVLGKPIEELTLDDLRGVDHARLARDSEALDNGSRQQLRDKLEDLHAAAESGRSILARKEHVARTMLDAMRAAREVGRQDAVPFAPAPPRVPVASASTDPRAALTLEGLLDNFFNDRPSLSESTKTSHRQVMRDFHRRVGNKGIGSITKADVADYKDWLQSQPGRNGRPKAAHATIEKNLNHVRSMLKWASEEAGILDSSPGEKVKPPKQGDDANEPKRLPLQPEHLAKLFASPLYTGCDGPRRWSKPGSYRAPPDRRYFMLVMFLAGARTEELPGAGIYDLDGIPCLDLLVTGTKTRAGARLVPILPELRKTGFLAWARERIAGGGTLFEGAGVPADWSQWTGRYFDSIGIDDPLLPSYSLRHSFKVMMRGGNLNTETMNRIFGHEEGTTGEIYGKGLLIAKEARAFLKAVKATVDLSHLYVSR